MESARELEDCGDDFQSWPLIKIISSTDAWAPPGDPDLTGLRVALLWFLCVSQAEAHGIMVNLDLR